MRVLLFLILISAGFGRDCESLHDKLHAQEETFFKLSDWVNEQGAPTDGIVMFQPLVHFNQHIRRISTKFCETPEFEESTRLYLEATENIITASKMMASSKAFRTPHNIAVVTKTGAVSAVNNFILSVELYLDKVAITPEERGEVLKGLKYARKEIDRAIKHLEAESNIKDMKQRKSLVTMAYIEQMSAFHGVLNARNILFKEIPTE